MAIAIDIEALRAWIGREEVTMDIATPAALAGLAALLDHDVLPWTAGQVPPLAHWLYFLPRVRHSMIDVDGHPRRGGFLPPVPLPRRMWAGGEVRFLEPIKIGAAIERRSTIRNVAHKRGASGDLVFVTVEHEVRSEGTLAIVERQDLVYRSSATVQQGSGTQAPATPTPAPRRADIERSITSDPVALFRFSALTFNGHRIHYDRNYARDVEGYAGLVVQGPFVATLLMDHALRHYPGRTLSSFSFRGVRPLIDAVPFTLCAAEQKEELSLWSRDADGQETMVARVR